MKNRFDELTKGMARSVTRRGVLKKLGVGLTGIVLACFGLANSAEAAANLCNCVTNADCSAGRVCSSGTCIPSWCGGGCCCQNRQTYLPKCSPDYSICRSACRIQIK